MPYNRHMQRNILITGGAGYIGSAITVTLLQAGHQITVFDDESTGQPNLLPKTVGYVKGDITDITSLEELCRDQAFDLVIHCAGKKAVGESEMEPSKYFHNNVLGSLNILRVMEQYSIPEIIFSSTAAVYATLDSKDGVTEESEIQPNNVYGLSKRMVEEMIESYARLGKIKKYTIFRYFNVAGDIGLKYKENNAQNVFPKIAKAIHDKSEFCIFGANYETLDGTGVRDYIHLRDLVVAHQLAIEAKAGGTFNLGTGTGYSVRELLDMFAGVYGEKVQSKLVERRAGDPAKLVANAELARIKLGWSAKETLRGMVESTKSAYL